MARRDGITMWLDGEKELYVNMQKRMDLSTKAGREALQKAGLKIVAEAKENLRNNSSVVTGMLRASGKVQRVEGDEDSVDAGFFSDKTTGGYAFFVEYGRRAGKMPPPDMLIQWCRKKLRLPEKIARARGWAMARKIAKKGTRPHPFFKPAIESTKKDVEQILKEAIKKEIDKNE
jgi:HK97 gp10 family phage protein